MGLERPKSSIGMPVYNGERFLEEALDSLLSQSHEDFELVIADNASTDATEEICRTYALRDSRLRYVRNRANYGVVYNFNNVFRLTSGEYFKWAAYDDVCEPDFLSRCVEALDRDQTVVLACPRIGGIDEEGRKVEFLAMPGPGQGVVANMHLGMYGVESTASDDPAKRWKFMMENLWWTPQLYGLIRADAVAKTNLHPAHYMGDHILLAELALHGRFHEVPEELLFLRVHPSKTSNVTGAATRLAVAEPDQDRGRSLLPLRQLLVYPARVSAHVSSVRRAPLTVRQRCVCYYELFIAILRWALEKGRGFAGWPSSSVTRRG